MLEVVVFENPFFFRNVKRNPKQVYVYYLSVNIEMRE